MALARHPFIARGLPVLVGAAAFLLLIVGAIVAPDSFDELRGLALAGTALLTATLAFVLVVRGWLAQGAPAAAGRAGREGGRDDLPRRCGARRRRHPGAGRPRGDRRPIAHGRRRTDRA